VFTVEKHFEFDSEINNQINQSQDIYIASPEEKTEVVLKVSPAVAHYFKRRDLLPNQVIDKELDSGELIISSKVAHDLQIIPLIKYWMPHLQVISPKEIHEQVITDIEKYQQTK
jgi:predicted DNA-binding transcriptional regulator YafY